MAPATTGHRSLIIRIIAYHFGDHLLKLQGFIGIVALQGLSGLYSDRIDTVPYTEVAAKSLCSGRASLHATIRGVYKGSRFGHFLKTVS
jgi:hypothetical protein